MTVLFGVVSEFVHDAPASHVILAAFDLIEVRKIPEHRPPGICFMQLIVTPRTAIPLLGLLGSEKLWFGGDVPLNSTYSDLLPFTTGAYGGFIELSANTTMGVGSFFETLEEAQRASANIYGSPRIVDLTA